MLWTLFLSAFPLYFLVSILFLSEAGLVHHKFPVLPKKGPYSELMDSGLLEKTLENNQSFYHNYRYDCRLGHVTSTTLIMFGPLFQ